MSNATVANQGAAFEFLSGVSDYAGLVSLTTLLFMIVMDHWAINISKYGVQHFVRLMVWADALAFLINYGSLAGAETLDQCGSIAIAFICDMIWNFKDAFKYAYITNRCAGMFNIEHNWYPVAVFLSSLSLYFFYMAEAYKGIATCTPPDGSEIELIAISTLYTFWMAVDVVTATGVLFKLINFRRSSALLPKLSTSSSQSSSRPLAGSNASGVAIPTSNNNNINNANANKNSIDADQIIRRTVRKEQFRLLFCSILMLIITIQSYANLRTKGLVPISRTLFVFVQLVIYGSTIRTKSDIIRQNDTRLVSVESHDDLQDVLNAQSPRISAVGERRGSTPVLECKKGNRRRASSVGTRPHANFALGSIRSVHISDNQRNCSQDIVVASKDEIQAVQRNPLCDNDSKI